METVLIFPGNGCNRARQHLWFFLLLVGFMCFGMLAEAQESCGTLKELYNRKGFLSRKRQFQYCAFGCDFIGKCSSLEPEPGLFVSLQAKYKIVRESVTNIVSGDETGWFAGEDEPMLDDDVIDGWKTMAERLVPFSLAVIPVVLNQWKASSFYTSLLSILVFLSLSVSGWMPVDIAIHNSLVSIVCLMMPANSAALIEMIAPLIVMFMAMFASVFQNGYIQLLVLGLVIAVDAAYIFELFFKRRAGSQAAILVMVAQMYVLIEQQRFVREEMALRNFSSACIEMFLNSVLPSGKSMYWCKNAGSLAYLAVTRAKFSVDKVTEFVSFLVMQAVMLLMFRASLGAYLISTMRYDFSADTLVKGWFVYLLDLYGPLEYVGRLVFRYERSNYRRTCYAVVCGTLSFFEARHAMELFLLRIFVSSLDRLVFRTSYGRVTKYLGMQVDFRGNAFPQEGAKAWMSLEEVWKAGSCTRRVIADRIGATVSGLGFIRGEEDKQYLMTARHVVRDAQSIRVMPEGLVFQVPIGVNSSLFRHSDDPVQSVPVHDFVDASGIPLLCEQEIESVESIYVVSLDDEGRCMIVCVPQFTFKAGGELRCSVNLRSGDSGGPVIGVLKNGALRYVGCVSKGSFDQGAGNIVSVLLHSKRAEPEVVPSDVDRVEAFNKRRLQGHALMALIERFNETVNAIADASDALDVASEQLEGGARREGGDRDEADTKKGRRAKKRAKDRAFQKRRVLYDEAVGLAERLYSVAEVHFIKERLLEGRIRVKPLALWKPQPGRDMIIDDPDVNDVNEKYVLAGTITGGV